METEYTVRFTDRDGGSHEYGPTTNYKQAHNHARWRADEHHQPFIAKVWLYETTEICGQKVGKLVKQYK